MDLSRKLELLDAAVVSISNHTDEDSVVLLAVLNQAQSLIEARRDELVEAVNERAAAVLAG